MRREFVVVEQEDDYGEVILSLAALEVRNRRRLHPARVHCLSLSFPKAT